MRCDMKALSFKMICDLKYNEMLKKYSVVIKRAEIKQEAGRIQNENHDLKHEEKVDDDFVYTVSKPILLPPIHHEYYVKIFK